jgi:hypothetical protein
MVLSSVPIARTILSFLLFFVLGGCEGKKDPASQPAGAAPSSLASGGVGVPGVIATVASLENANDPKKLFADPSITKFPAKELVYGNGQTLSIEYDGRKSKPNEPVFFNLTMIRPDGIVVDLGSDTFDGRTPGRVFTKANKVFRSEADGRPGFVEITIVVASGLDANGKISGKNVMIGRFPIKYQVGN